ncbi:hypothetical protein ACJVDH_01065 [Pedobacter sp. AW1-32]|uniref:hypothetical protein n=1 Tax=Pedobacter sp. AW1-32 TaxID=3383026 RepID=UPI003FEFD118
MAILHKKEEKIQAVLGRLPQKYTNDEFVEMFIKLYSKDWGKIKTAYIKQSQDKEVGTVISMPKPADYLKQVLKIYLQNTPVTAGEDTKVEEAEVTVEKKAVKKASTKKTSEPLEKNESETVEKPVKKATAKKVKTEDKGIKIEKPKAAAKKAPAKSKKD